MKLLEFFLPTGKPILGICRGAQVMNVYFGGTLHQDINPIKKCAHVDRAAIESGIHYVTLKRDSKLAKIFGKTEVWVNSLHHQAVNRVGKELIAAAWSPDGFIEGIEASNHLFCIGVQWHPEHMAPADETQRKLFEAFLEACRK